MTEKFVDLWGWVSRARAAARRAGDEARVRLTSLDKEAWGIFETDPHRALALYEEGLQLAEQLQEPCWQIFYKYWRIEAYIFYLCDLREAKRLAVDLAVEARKPVYGHCPVRARIYRILVDSYLFSDPIGYANQIQENLDYLENEVPLDEDTWRLIPGRRSTLAIYLDQFEEAQRHALTYLERSQDSDFRLSDAYSELSHISFKLGEFDKLFEYAQTGEVHARRIERQGSLAELLLWQAVYYQLQDREKEAKRLVQQAQRHISNIARAEAGFISLAQYYEIGGELEKSLAERAKIIAFSEKCGFEHNAIETRIEYCKLLVKMGLPVEKEAGEARARANQMPRPEHYLKKLDALEVDST
jgi:hypothetical protein